jgi:hypothetical protein
MPEPAVLHCVGDVYAGPATLADPGLLRPARELLQRADVRFGNLEAPLLDHGRAEPGGGIRLRMPTSAVSLVRELGLDVVTLANNHMLDYGPAGARSTLAALRRAGVPSVGAGVRLSEAQAPVVLEARGQKLAFLGACDDQGGGAGDEVPGVNLVSPARLLAQVQRLRARVDHVIVGVHTGIEFAPGPEPFFLSLARRLIEAGASVVVGHHPHVPQGVVRHRNGLIACSLGDFLFDLSRDDEELTPKQRTHNRLHPVLEVRLGTDGVVDHAVHWLRRDERGAYEQAPEGPAAGAELDALMADPGRLAEATRSAYEAECFGFLYSIYAAFYLAVRRGEWGKLSGLAWWLPTLRREPKRRVIRNGLWPALARGWARLRGAG